MLTRQDIISFLSTSSDVVRDHEVCDQGHSRRSRGRPRRPARRSFRSTKPRPIRKTRVGEHKGFDYSRTVNPTRVALEQQLASLEDAQFGSAFASGMAATSAMLNLLSAGDHVVVTRRSLRRNLPALRARARTLRARVHLRRHDRSRCRRSAPSARTRKLLWLETPTNPLLKLIDIAAIASLQGRADQFVVVDNTFATPYFQQPLELGADVVVHSTTKYMDGHSDVVGGVAITTTPRSHEPIKFHQNAVGGVPGPFDAWLVDARAKTLAVRMREHAQNAHDVAEFLETHAEVERVLLSRPCDRIRSTSSRSAR